MFRLRNLAPLVALAALVGCRQDMQDQPRYKPLARSDFFADQRASRTPVDGTIARGQLKDDTYLYTGKIGNNPGEAFPFPVTKQVLERGQERYDIFCAPCHSKVGDGNGMIPSRGFARKPPSYHIQRLRTAPAGYFYDVATNGFGIMQGYAAQIPVNDRWAIVAYVRALQLSQNATAADVGEHALPSPEVELLGDVPSGATQPQLKVKKQSEEGEKK